MKFLQYLILYAVFLVLAFPSFYFNYKYGKPEPLAHDFFQYYYLYKDFDIRHVIAPHNMRLAGSFFVCLFYKLNFFYDTPTAFDQYASWGFLKQVYFNALLFNYLCVTATSLMIFKIIQKQFHTILLSFMAGLLYLLGFGTLFYELSPLTDAFSVLLFALAFYAYLEKKALLFILLPILIFQREYVLIVFATLAFIDVLSFKGRYAMWVGISSALCFVVYLILRKTFFYTPHLDYQASADYFWKSLFTINYSVTTYLKQLLLTLNLLFLYLGILVYKKWNKLPVDNLNLLKISILFFQINLICHVAGHGTNCGRYFYIISPMIIFLTVKEMLPVLKAKNMLA